MESPESERVKLNPPQNVPLSGAVQFVGRQHELETLELVMQGNDRVAHVNIVAIAGMGGVGKTELAIQYAKQFAQFYPGGVCYLQAKESNLADLALQIVDFAKLYSNILVPPELSDKQKIVWWWQNWPSPGQVLLVLDDVIDLTIYRDVLPLNHRFRVLVTTRLKDLDPCIRELSLDVLSLKTSLELLTRLISQNRIECELKVAEDLCRWLGCLPLALELVGRYLIKNPDLSLIELLERLKTQGLQDESINEKSRSKSSLMTAQRGVKAAFELSWQQLDCNAPQLAQLLGYLNLNVISWEQVELIAQKLNWTQQNLKDAKNQLNKLHLIQSSSKGFEKIHPLIREFLREKLRQSGNIEVFRQAIEASMMPIAVDIIPPIIQIKYPEITPRLYKLKQLFLSLPVVLKFSLIGGSVTIIVIVLVNSINVLTPSISFGEKEKPLSIHEKEKPLLENDFTRGEEALTNQNKSLPLLCKQALEKKKHGMQAFAAENFPLAQDEFQDSIKLFKEAHLQCSVDPETQIFLNNAKANMQGTPLTIAVVVPIDGSELFNHLSEEVLRGVAHVQDKFNQSNGIQGQLLQVIIARDDNQPEKGRRVAKHFGENDIPGDINFKGNILGVIGPFTSDVTQPSGEVYERHKLVAVSPISTAVRQSNPSPSGYQFKLSKYVFRTAPSDSVAVENLFKYAQKISGSGQAAIFFNSKQIYSSSGKEAFEKKFYPQQVISCDLFTFSVLQCIDLTKNSKFRMLNIGSGEAEKVLSAISRNQNKLPLLGGDALYNEDKLRSEVVDSSKNMVLAVGSHRELFSDSFKKESLTLWGTQDVGWRTATAYDATQAIVEGLKRDHTRGGLYDALSSGNFSADGATAKIQFDKLHDRKVDPRVGVLVKVQKKCEPDSDKKSEATQASNYVFCLLKNY